MAEKHDESRRKFLSRPVKIIPAVALAGTGMAQVSGALAQSAPGESLAGYKPVYFQEDEWQFLLAACDRLIPAEEAGPGAIAAHVPVFIDKQMLTPYGDGGLWYMQGPFHPDAVPELGYQLKYTPKEIYRTGIADTQAYCQKQYAGKRYQDLTEEEQIKVLSGLESGDVVLENIPGKTFFQYLLTNTKEGYFSDPMYGGNQQLAGWKTVGFPGARADYMDWIEQPNKAYPFGPVSIEGKRG
jgi:gluconate 2-dehydrogenase gamma chain